jgi:phospholipase/carboxylesterase
MSIYQVLEEGRPLAEAEKAIILLHGRGGNAEGIIPLANEFCDETFYISAPQATGHSWYPYSFLVPESQNEPWFSSSVQSIKQLLDLINEYIPSEKIWIMGFSQGACLALEVTAQHAVRYAGVAAFTGGLTGEKINTGRYKGNFEGTKIFIGNSDNDPHVPLSRTEETKSVLENMGAAVTLKIYPNMPHTIIRDEIETVLNLLF